MGSPAARLADMTQCGLVEANGVPHVGGPIVGPGEPRVLINSLPAARVQDATMCLGPPGQIDSGSSTVFIGKRAAARMGDPTNHGALIVTGSPNVNIGD